MDERCCENCKSHLGGGQCRDNLERECAAGGGYEAWKPCEEAPSNERVTLTLTREHARVVERACELFARLNIGQFNIVTEMLMDFRHGMDDYCWRRSYNGRGEMYGERAPTPERGGARAGAFRIGEKDID